MQTCKTQSEEACVAKQTGSVKKLSTQGTETVRGNCDKQEFRWKVLCEYFVIKGDDLQCSASAHLTMDKETESTSKLNRPEHNEV